MEDNRIQNQIAIYMTNKKLCEFTDKLKPAPIEYYGVVSSSGFGDGGYACYTHADKSGEIDFACIVFIEE